MRSFRIKLEPGAKKDIQKGIEYYNETQKGLGRKFHAEVKNSIATIRKNPFYQVRYDVVRCLPLDTFPFMIHFTVDESDFTATIYGVINTSLDPDKSWIPPSSIVSEPKAIYKRKKKQRTATALHR